MTIFTTARAAAAHGDAGERDLLADAHATSLASHNWLAASIAIIPKVKRAGPLLRLSGELRIEKTLAADLALQPVGFGLPHPRGRIEVRIAPRLAGPDAPESGLSDSGRWHSRIELPRRIDRRQGLRILPLLAIDLGQSEL